MSKICGCCKKNLHSDEIAMTRKMLNRGIKQYYCFECLADFFDLTRQDVIQMMKHYKAMGCTLFVSNRMDDPEKIY